MNKTILTCASSVVALACGLACQTASAQAVSGSALQDPATVGQAGPSQTSVSDVVVTARRRQERLRDIPIAGDAIDAQQIENRGGVSNVQDLVQNVPGVRFFNTSSQVNSEISIRASGTARGTNADPSVGLYRNGVYIGGGFLGGRNFTAVDLFDVGRVEVLRGTQGALYGRDAVGGSVNIVSAQPVFRDEGYIDINYAPKTQAERVQLVVNHPLSDILSVRLGADYINQDKGFFYNPNNNVYFDQDKGFHLRGQLRLKTGRLDANLLAENQVEIIPAVAFRVFIRPGATPAFPVGYVQPEYSYPWNYPPLAKQNVTTDILSVNYDLNWATLSSTSAYRERRSMFSYDTDGIDTPTLAMLNATGDDRGADVNSSTTNADVTRTVSQDVHLTGEKVQGWSWLFGVEAISQITNYNITTGRTPSAANGNSPGLMTRGVQKYDSTAAYGSVGYDLTDSFNITGDARYTEDEKKIASNRFDRITGVQSGGAAFILNDTFSPVNTAYSLTGSYKFPHHWLGYAKVGTGYRAGGFNYNLGDVRQPKPIPAAYGNEISTTYELGAKGDVAPWLYVTGAVYKTHVHNLIAQTDNGCAVGTACPVASTPFLFNGGNASSWGVELEANAHFQTFGGPLTMTASGSHQHGKVISGQYSGAQLPQVPDWIASATANYRHAFVADSSVFFNLNYQAAWGGFDELTAPGTAFYNTSAQGPFNAPMHDFQLVDLRAGINCHGFEAAVYAKNAFDYHYVIYEAITTQRLNPPKLVGFELRYHW